MRNLTGYEPKTAGGRPSGTRGSGQPLMQASAAADAALVPLPHDSLAEDLDNLSHLTSLQSFLDEDEPMLAASPGENTLVSTSTMPSVVVAQSVAGGDSIASSSEIEST